MEKEERLLDKRKKSKLSTNVYVPPPARKSADQLNIQGMSDVKSKDRVESRLETLNTNTKACNNSSLLFKMEETSYHYTTESLGKKKWEEAKRKTRRKKINVAKNNTFDDSNTAKLINDTSENTLQEPANLSIEQESVNEVTGESINLNLDQSDLPDVLSSSILNNENVQPCCDIISSTNAPMNSEDLFTENSYISLNDNRVEGIVCMNNNGHEQQYNLENSCGIVKLNSNIYFDDLDIGIEMDDKYYNGDSVCTTGNTIKDLVMINTRSNDKCDALCQARYLDLDSSSFIIESIKPTGDLGSKPINKNAIERSDELEEGMQNCSITDNSQGNQGKHEEAVNEYVEEKYESAQNCLLHHNMIFERPESNEDSLQQSSSTLCYDLISESDDDLDDWEQLWDHGSHFLEFPQKVPSESIKILKPERTEPEKECNSNNSSIIEIFGFPEEFKTQDLMASFTIFLNRGFKCKWVDNTHALGIFPSPSIADEALNAVLPFVKTRPITQASAASREKVKTFLLPSSLRPKTCSALARRLVSGALGVKAVFTDEERAAERNVLKEAREQKRLAAKQRDAAWEGKF